MAMVDRQEVSPETYLEVAAPSRKRSLVLLAYYFPPANESGALRPYRFFKYLPEHGHRTTVITAIPQGGKGASEIITAPDQSRKGWSSYAASLAQRIYPYNDRLQWVPNAVASAESLLRADPAPVIVSTSPPLSAHVAALCLRRRYAVKWVADFRDPVYGNPFRLKKLARWGDRWLEQQIVSQADMVIANTDAAEAELKRRYPQASDKIRLIWNGYDPDDGIGPAAIPARGHRVLGHFGSIYGGRHPGELLASVDRLSQRGLSSPERLRIRLIGYLEMNDGWLLRSRFREVVQAGILEYTGQVAPLDEARREMAQSDYLLLLDVNASGAGVQVPAKLFEYIRIGRPILAWTARNSPAERILQNAGIPHACVYPGEMPDVVDRKVLEFLSLPNTPTPASAWFHQQFNALHQVQKLSRFIDELGN